MNSPVWYRRLGPGLITACVLIGPGSIMTSSTVGAKYGFSMLWIVVLSSILMMVFMTLGARLGAVIEVTPAQVIRRMAGRGLAVFVGLAVFSIAALFQSGNNIGVASALEGFIHSKLAVAALMVLLNALAISFMFVFKDTYRMLERLMATFVGVMLGCFAVNLIRLHPNISELLGGFMPSLDGVDLQQEMLPLLGMVGTTFVVTAAYYQAYLVQQKGWGIDDIRHGMVDVRVSAIIILVITLMLISTAATAFHGMALQDPSFQLASPLAVADGLQKTFGDGARIIFCLGLFSAAYSSYLINSMIGGYMAADGLGWDVKQESVVAKCLATLVLLVGMVIGLAVVVYNFDRTPTIIVAQALTVVASPLVAGGLLWVARSPQVMGTYVSSWWLRSIALLGFLVLVAMALKTAFYDLPAALAPIKN